MLRKTIIIIIVILALTSQSRAAQFARPSGTISSSSWIAVNAPTHHEAIDEVTANGTTDYVESSAVSTLDVNLSGVIDPGVHDTHEIRLTVYSDKNGASFNVELYEGGIPISTSGSFSPTRNQWAQRTYTLPTGDAANITDYSNLSLRINLTSTANGYLQVTQAELEVPDVVAAPPTITSPNVYNITDTAATFEANITSNGGVSITQHGTKWNTTGPPVDQNVSTLGPTSPTLFIDSRTVSAGSLIYFRAYATNAQGTSHTSDVAFRTEPGVQANNVTFSGLGDSFMTINWTPGSGGSSLGSIVLVKENGVIDSDPVDGTEYINPATVFGTGDQIGSGNYVVYAGTGSSVPITNLNPGSTYSVAVYAYAGSGTGLAGINYRQGSPAANSQLIIGPPALTTVSSSNVTATAADLQITLFSDGGGTITEHGTIWKLNSAPSPTDHPTTLGTYGGAIPGSFNDSVSGLDASSLIYYQGYATNGDGTTYSDVGTLYTEPSVSATNISIPTGTSENMTINWTAGDGDGAIVVAKAGSAVNSDPVDNSEYSFDSGFGGGDDLGGGNFVVYSGSATSANISGLVPGTTYHLAVFEYKGFGITQGGRNYKITAPATASQLIVGAPQIADPNATNIDINSATLEANVISDGGAGSVDARGTLWNTTGDPVIENQLAEGGSSTGIFSHVRTGLPAGSLVYYRAYTTNSFGTSYTPSKTFFTEPATQPSGVNFTTVEYYAMDINWTRGDGDGVVVVVREGSAVNTDPTDGVVHLAQTGFGAPAAEIGTGNFVVYRGNGTQVRVVNLTPQTTYHVAVYEYVGSGSGQSGINYQQDTPATGSELSGDPPIGHNYSNAIQCDQCHALHSGVVPYDADQVTACVTQCHNVSGPASSMPIAETALHTQGGIDCGGCHEVHTGSGAQANLLTTNTHAGGTTQTNLKLLRGNVTKYAPNAIEPMIYHFDYRVDDSHLAFADGDERTGGGYDGVCQACHTTSQYHRNGVIGGSSGHANERDHPAEQSGSAGKNCIDCHFHATGFTPEISQDLSCVDPSCHVQGQGPHRAVGGEFGLTSHHITGTGTDEDCLVCHEHTTHPDSGASGVRLLHPDTGAVITVTSPVTRNINSDALEAEILDLQNNFCFPCHDSDGAQATYNTTDGADPTHPFSTGALVPNIYDQFDPAGDFHHSVRAAGNNPYTVLHSGYTTMLPPWNQDTTHDVITCFDCHSVNGHGDTAQRMLRVQVDFDAMEANVGGSYPSTLVTQVKDFCTMCHDPFIYASGDVAGSSFVYHAPGQNGHLNSNDLGCMGCHAGIVDEDKISGVDNGAARGLIHGGSFTWPTGSKSPGQVTDTFIVGGWMSGWLPSGGSVDCWGGECNHDKAAKSYTLPAP